MIRSGGLRLAITHRGRNRSQTLKRMKLRPLHTVVLYTPHCLSVCAVYSKLANGGLPRSVPSRLSFPVVSVYCRPSSRDDRMRFHSDRCHATLHGELYGRAGWRGNIYDGRRSESIEACSRGNVRLHYDGRGRGRILFVLLSD